MACVFALRSAGKGVTHVRQPANAASTGVQTPPARLSRDPAVALFDTAKNHTGQLPLVKTNRFDSWPSPSTAPLSSTHVPRLKRRAVPLSGGHAGADSIVGMHVASISISARHIPPTLGSGVAM